ncbi:MAG TPA: DUF1223 domain-containing protein [Steroidobacteraceae bacterium]
MLLTAAAWGQSSPTVVELYTSEGCSSCPPAEAQIGELSRQDGVIALAFHVDYWDSLGWKDRFELPVAVARQKQYAQRLHLASIYTPQLVIDGARDQVGGGKLAGTGAGAGHAAGVPLDLAINHNQLQISVGAQPQTSACDVLLVSYLPEAVSKVTRGENAGRELHDFNIVRSFTSLGSWQGQAHSFTVPLSSLPSDATTVVVLVQQKDQGPILGAASHAVR